jgi:hypothetical protein
MYIFILLFIFLSSYSTLSDPYLISRHSLNFTSEIFTQRRRTTGASIYSTAYTLRTEEYAGKKGKSVNCSTSNAFIYSANACSAFRVGLTWSIHKQVRFQM